MAGNVNLIDPNNSNINRNQTNAIPQYQDMYISLELTAIKRDRTVLSTNIDTDITKIKEKASQDADVISFLGQNQNPNNSAHYNKFTTNYYDRENDVETTYEGFGINSVNIVVNSSYIPQIDVEFIDIRGLAFFNRENSPYRILFNFPPPIFHLTFKGYYGKPLTYQMHLVKYNTEFNADTGNYHIKAQFIAITYAPLTDILYRYIIQAPLMFPDEQTLSSNPDKRPRNTFDLLLKLENLYSELPEKIKTDVDNIRYENTQKKLKSYNNVFEILYNFRNKENLKANSGNLTLFIRNEEISRESDIGRITEIQSFSEYNEYLESFQMIDLPNKIGKKLFIGYHIETNNELDTSIDERNNKLKDRLNKYKNNLITSSKKIIDRVYINDINAAEEINSETGANTNDDRYVKYVGINITQFYAKVYKNRFLLENKKKSAMNQLNEKINNMIHKKLGMLPTIYNIFEILLNDVDDFFKKLRNTAIEAENNHHNKETYRKLIVNDGTYRDVKNVDNPKIYAFPLIIRREEICNQTKEVRTAPVNISKRLDEPFPELTLVQEFINSFIKYNRIYKQATLKDERNAKGDYKWIPFTPADSKLVNFNIKSPYFGTDSAGGGSIQQPINLLETDKLTQIFEILLKRFYILSQNSLIYSFYNIPDDTGIYNTSKRTSKNYITLYAKAEAINLANSITNEEYAKLLKEFSQNNRKPNQLTNPTSGFFTYIEKFVNDLYTKNTKYYTLSNGDDMYRNKNNEQYVGFSIVSMDSIGLRSGDSGDEFDVFIENNETKWYEYLIGKREIEAEESFEFTEDNLIFRKDTVTSDDVTNESNLRTKFVASPATFYKRSNNQIMRFFDPSETIRTLFYEIGKYNPFVDIEEPENTDNNKINPFFDFPYEEIVDKVSNVGNKFFALKEENGQGTINYYDKLNTKEKNNVSILETWVNSLAAFDVDIYDEIIKYNGNVQNPHLTALIYLSCFGYTLSAFNYYPYGLNEDFFVTPSIVEIPLFLQLYMGALVNAKESGYYDEIYNFFVNGSGSVLKSGGILIFADFHDINTYLSINDKDTLRQRYLEWYTDDFNDLASSVDSLYKKINGDENNDGLFFERWMEEEGDSSLFDKIYRVTMGDDVRRKLFNVKAKVYEEQLSDDTKYSNILTKLVDRRGIAIFNEITFRYNTSIQPVSYLSLEEQNNINERNEINKTYFSSFFSELSSRIEDRLNTLQEETEEFKNSTGDEDILTQTYYSFKNINDKWLSGLDNKAINGYPFKTNRNEGLISQFAFVDRAMNPIGDTIIDPKPLIDAKNSPELSIFGVISQLLSSNGFEFFPLQNFMKFTEEDWNESFRIDTSGKQKEYPVFVCMYIGGSASYPSNINSFSPFDNDGIMDLENPNVNDFLNEGCSPDPDKDNQVDTLTNDGEFLHQVRAFKVRYGEQNQNMFYGFEVDSKEYPETNESIQILSKLAGDNREQAPVPKGQNLYNIYENRAYRATITGFGNAMIQPTQYFQLENVPIYNGAYVILTVEHSIEDNRMTTKFSGTKLLKYPMPRVKNPASIIGFEGGSTADTNADAAEEATQEGVTLGVGTANNPDPAKYNSMYTLEIY